VLGTSLRLRREEVNSIWSQPVVALPLTSTQPSGITAAVNVRPPVSSGLIHTALLPYPGGSDERLLGRVGPSSSQAFELRKLGPSSTKLWQHHPLL